LLQRHLLELFSYFRSYVHLPFHRPSSAQSGLGGATLVFVEPLRLFALPGSESAFA
jgi:hypothetical protein